MKGRDEIMMAFGEAMASLPEVEIRTGADLVKAAMGDFDYSSQQSLIMAVLVASKTMTDERERFTTREMAIAALGVMVGRVLGGPLPITAEGENGSG